MKEYGIHIIPGHHWLRLLDSDEGETTMAATIFPASEFPIPTEFHFPGGKEVVIVPDIEMPSITKDTKPLEIGEEFQRGKMFFEENKEKIINEYEGKYIAIFGRKVVESDKDFSVLAKRVYKKFGYQPIYMPKVTKKEQIARIPSPRKKK